MGLPVKSDPDVEKSSTDRDTGTGTDTETCYVGSGSGTGNGNAVPEEDFTAGDSWYARVQKMAGKLGVEQRGIERVPSDERTKESMSEVGTMVSKSCGSCCWLLFGFIWLLTKLHWEVALSQHGCLVVRHRRIVPARVWTWLCRHGADDRLHQRAWGPAHLFLLYLRTPFRPASDGAIPVLVRFLRREVE